MHPLLAIGQHARRSGLDCAFSEVKDDSREERSRTGRGANCSEMKKLAGIGGRNFGREFLERAEVDAENVCERGHQTTWAYQRTQYAHSQSCSA